MGSDQSRANRRDDSLSGSTGSNGTTPTKYDVYQSNNSTLSRDRSGHEGEHFAMQRSSKLKILSFVGFYFTFQLKADISLKKNIHSLDFRIFLKSFVHYLVI